jgi:hypothetical protein
VKTELQVLNQLELFIAENINTYLEQGEEFLIEEISQDNVKVDYPDTDNMKRDTMFFIVPDTENFDELTINSDLADLNTTLYILCKKDKQENLIKKVFAYFSSLYLCIKSDTTLSSFVDATNLTSMDFYPAVEGNKSVVGIEVRLNIHFTKDF